MKKIIFILPLLLLLSCDDGSEPYTPGGSGGTKPPAEKIESHKRAKEIFDLINNHYKVTTVGLYNESYPAQGGDPTYSYLWPYDGLVGGAATLTELGYDVGYTTMVDNFEKYWRTSADGVMIGGYGSSSNGTTGGGTRYYDDNSIVGLSLIEAYHITKDTKYITRAKRIVDFLKSGTDSQLGGGLWWNEDEKNIPGIANSNKPACANGYATLFLLEYYAVCDASEKAAVLTYAKQLYTWLRANLYDSDTKCYWNDINANGTVNKTRDWVWTYNTGVMIQNGLRLFKITGTQQYMDEAKISADGSYDEFAKMRNGILSYPDHDPWFNTKLLRAYIDIAPYHKSAEKYVDTYFNFINNGYDKARTADGFFYEDWTGASPKRYQGLLMQAAVVESYGAIAIYKGESAK